MSLTNLCSIFRTKNNSLCKAAIRNILESEDKEYIITYFHFFSLYVLNNNIGDVNLATKILNILHQMLYDPFKGTITLTFGEVAESHVGMQKIGEMDDRGFSYSEIKRADKYFSSRGCETLLIHLNDFLPEEVDDMTEEHQLRKTETEEDQQAWIFVARNGLECLTGDSKGKAITTEMLMFEWDTKLYNERRKIVQEKRARHNLNFSTEKQKADFAHGKGTTVPWSEVPILTDIRSKLINAFGDAAKTLKGEGNLYFNPKNTGIGYHGDTERRKVIGVRLGKEMTIHYMWFYNDRPRGLNMSVLLQPGDVYCMSEKTVGTSWRAAPKKRYTLRHAAGAEKYTTKTPKVEIRNMRRWEHNDQITVGDIYYKPKKSKTYPNPTWELMPQ